MYEIFAIERGRITKVDEIQDNVWINMVRPTPEEVEMVASVLNIDKAPIMAALDDEEVSGNTLMLPSTLRPRQLSANCQIETPFIDGK